MNQSKPETKKDPVFKSEAVFRRRLHGYIEHCNEKKRIPNPAGFCRYCEITRADFAALQTDYPRLFDVAKSTFLDEALNTKAANTGSMMQFLLQMGEEDAQNGNKGDSESCIRLICEHDGIADGA